jgi:hypothetical protein
MFASNLPLIQASNSPINAKIKLKPMSKLSLRKDTENESIDT